MFAHFLVLFIVSGSLHSNKDSLRCGVSYLGSDPIDGKFSTDKLLKFGLSLILGAALQFKYLLVDPVKYDVKYQVTSILIYSIL
jgi:hypothetical protein